MNLTENLSLKKPELTEKYDVSVFNDNMDVLDSAVNYNSLPVGAIIIYAGTSALDGFLECNGQAISRTTYAELFKKIGTTYGKGDSSSTFNLPDYSNRVPIGVSSSIDLGAKGGASTHVHALDDNGFAKISAIGGMGSGVYGIYKSINTVSSGTKIAGSASDSEVSYGTPLGGKTAIGNNMQPYIGQRYMIKVLPSTEQDNSYSFSVEHSPIGEITEYAGSVAPKNYLMCDGSPISREVYSELFAVIGTTYGSGDGSTTFNLPNLKSRIPVGLNSSDTYFNTLGKTGGEKTHKLTIDEMPSHRHGNPVAVKNEGNADHYRSIFATNTEFWSKNDSNNATASTGGDQAHNNLQPYIVVNYIIRVKNVDGILNLFTETESNNLFSDNENSVPTVSLIKNLNKFSTSEERRVGTWYNGKPIYSKTITGTKAGSFALPSTIDEAWIDVSNSYQKRYVGDSDIRIYPLVINQVSSQAQNNPALADQQAGAFINIKDKTLRIEIGAGVISQGFVATIKYTKTTDTAQ